MKYFKLFALVSYSICFVLFVLMLIIPEFGTPINVLIILGAMFSIMGIQMVLKIFKDEGKSK